MRKRLFAALTAGALLLAGGAGAQPLIELGDDRILAAHNAARKGDRAALERLAASREPHILDGYVRYWHLSNLLAGTAPVLSAELQDFLRDEDGNVLGERLRADWLRRLASDGDWSGFMQLFGAVRKPDRELRCQAWTARLLTGDRSALAEVAAQWQDLSASHPSCDTVLRAAFETGAVSEDDLWWRARQQADSRRPQNVATTLGWLPAADAPARTDLNQAIGSPGPWLDRLAPNFAVTRSSRELALIALIRLAREDARIAYTRLLRIQDRLSVAERNFAYATIASHAAIDHFPEAEDYYRATTATELTKRQRAWRVRAALRALDWKSVRSAIDALPQDEQDSEEWTYWRGRALAATGHERAAAEAYERIAGTPSFYGILAGEELGRPFLPPAAGGTLALSVLEAAESDPGLRRALALFQLGLRAEATQEWIWALRERDASFRLAAAHLALRHNLYDRAINTAEFANPQSNFELRFLTPYRDLIEPQVLSQGLDLGWVYGVMRQESRFAAPARSSAGAQGLMQVMPATGKWVANRIGMRDYSPSRLSDPYTNVLLGTNYMRLILDGLDGQPVLASAGYNAGPGRARRWRDDKALEGAIYTETIPFDETRDYVKKVMANAVIYAAMLERQPQSLRERLGVIAPRPSAEAPPVSGEADGL